MKRMTTIFIWIALAAMSLLAASTVHAGVTAIDSTRLAYDATAGGWAYTLPTSLKGRAVALAVDFTKGDETQLNLAVGYQLADDARIYRLSERAYDDTAGDVTITLTATGKRLIPVPVPDSAAKLFIFPAFVDSGAGEGSAALDVRPW